MKKIIFVIVILAVLLFSGCDAMLEVFYPEFADDFNDTNRIFDISYSLSAFHYGVLVGSGKPLQLKLVTNGNPADAVPLFSPENFYDPSGWWTYFFDTNVDYDAWLWCDVNGDDILNGGDFRSAVPIKIDFTDGSTYKNADLGPTDFVTI